MSEHGDNFKKGLCNTRRPLSQYLAMFDIKSKDLRNILQDKKLLIIGGGKSPIKNTLRRMHISCHVTNIDPYVLGPDSADVLIESDFLQTDFRAEFDEVWASYSLPLYCRGGYRQAYEFYRRAALSLKPGGFLRIAGLPWHMDGIIIADHFPRTSINLTGIKWKLEDSLNCDDFKKATFTNGIQKKYSKNPRIYAEDGRHSELWQAPPTWYDIDTLHNLLEQKNPSHYLFSKAMESLSLAR